MNHFAPIFPLLGPLTLAAIREAFGFWLKSSAPSRWLLNTGSLIEFRRFLLAASCGITLISCGARPEKPGDVQALLPPITQAPSPPLSHSLRSHYLSDPLPPTRFAYASPADWVELTYKEIENELSGSSSSDLYLPTEGEETVRVQKLLDQMYDRLTAIAPDRFRSSKGDFRIPRPVVRVRDSKQVNASVVRLGVCRGANILFQQGSESHSSEETLVSSIDNRGRIGIFKRREVACIDRLSERLQTQDLAHALKDDVANDKCSWDASSNGLVVGSGCTYKEGRLPTYASGLLLTTTTNLFIITTGALIQFSSDHDLQLTLAHELAHYLYAHGSLMKKNYHYFYRQNNENFASIKPTANPFLNSIGERAVKLPSFRTQPIEGQYLHSEMFPYFREAIKRIIQPTCLNPAAACFSPCANLIEVVDESDNLKVFGNFPQSKLSPRALQLYWTYEREFLSCTASISLTESQDSLPLGSVSKKDATKIYWNADSQNKTSLKDLAIEMNQRFFEKDQHQTSILDEALKQRVGYFTTEEEADNLAIEWSFQFAIPSTQIFKYWINYAYSMDGKEQDAPLSFGYERCARFFQQHAGNIYEDEGSLVPIGSFADPHHSLCYRAFRTAKRLAARYKVEFSPSFIRDAVSLPAANQTTPIELQYSPDEQNSPSPHR